MSEFKAIYMNDGKSVDDLSLKLTTIVSDIHSLGDMVDEFSVVKKLFRVVPRDSRRLLPPSSSLGTSRNINLGGH